VPQDWIGRRFFPRERFLPFVVDYILRVSGYQQTGTDVATPAGTDAGADANIWSSLPYETLYFSEVVEKQPSGRRPRTPFRAA